MGDLFDLRGHVALVTGGNSGIGLGMAEGLAAHGADVAIWGTNAEKNEAAAEQLARHGTKVLSLICDVGDEAAVEESFAQTLEALGKVDSCFANAGVGGNGSAFVDITADEWHRVLRVNLDGVFYSLRAAVRHMVERGEGGSLAVTTSGSVLMGAPRGQPYASSKGAVIALMKGIAVEHARHGIRANAILPGWIETPMTAPAMGWDRFVDKVLPRVPLRRWGTGDDFSGVAVYLASDASRYHTGDVLVLDGGYAIF
ncbi:MAG TPA: SDR family NAD(P)-dependent oxidoreductase [Acidimicrobiales bacterium]|nr:SDR family NAD(P)-dependent oxidoreductase [Acidimicrobiales bacterium]